MGYKGHPFRGRFMRGLCGDFLYAHCSATRRCFGDRTHKTRLEYTKKVSCLGLQIHPNARASITLTQALGNLFQVERLQKFG